MSDTYQYSQCNKLSTVVEEQLTVFLNDCPGFHYFQSPQYFKVCLASKKLTPYYSIARAGDEIVGTLLYFRQVQLVLPLASLLSSRTIIWGGPVVRDGSAEVMEGLLRFYTKNAPVSIYTQVRNLVDTDTHRGLFRRYGFQYEAHLTILIDLSRSEADLWKGVHSKRRNQIRRAEKEGCYVEQQQSPEALQACYSILQEVYERARLPLPDFSHFESLLHQADAESGLRLFTVVWEGNIIGCMLCLAFGDWLFDYYAGAYSHFYKKYPNDLLPWAVFGWAQQNGFRYFDFGGAGKPDVPYGVREYKKQFGGEQVCYGRYERTQYPATFRLVNKGFALWKWLKR